MKNSDGVAKLFGIIQALILVSSFIVPRFNKLIGGILGLFATTIILVHGFPAYSNGGYLALKGVIPIPPWVFLAFIGLWYLADIGMIIAGYNARAGRSSGSTNADRTP